MTRPNYYKDFMEMQYIVKKKYIYQYFKDNIKFCKFLVDSRKNESCHIKVAWCCKNIYGSNTTPISANTNKNVSYPFIDRVKLFKRQTESANESYYSYL